MLWSVSHQHCPYDRTNALTVLVADNNLEKNTAPPQERRVSPWLLMRLWLEQ